MRCHSDEVKNTFPDETERTPDSYKVATTRFAWALRWQWLWLFPFSFHLMQWKAVVCHSFIYRGWAWMSRKSYGQRLLRNSQSFCVGWILYEVVGHNNGRRGHASRRQSQGQSELLPEHSQTLGLPSACLCCADDDILFRFPICTLWHKILRLVKHTPHFLLFCLTVILLARNQSC